MVSAVFHSPLETAAADVALGKKGAPAASTRAEAAAAALSSPSTAVRLPSVWREWALKILPPIAGLALLIAVWGLLTRSSTTFPTPWATFEAAVKLFSDPFYDKGPNDQGIGWNVLFSLERVALGFGLAAVVGIPLGFVIGRFAVLNRMVSPIISLLKPVSPLAWLPIGLLVFKAANPAAIWTIFIC